ALEVDIGDIIEFFFGVIQGGLGCIVAGIVDQDVNAAVCIDYVFDKAANAVDAGHIQRPDFGAPAQLTADLGRRFTLSDCAATQGQVTTILGTDFGNGLANAAPGAGHDNHLIRQFKTHTFWHHSSFVGGNVCVVCRRSPPAAIA